MMGLFHLQIYRRLICQFDSNGVVIQRGDDKVKHSKSWHASLLRSPLVDQSMSQPPQLQHFFGPLDSIAALY